MRLRNGKLRWMIGWGVARKRRQRGEPVVEAVMAATVEELGRAGYGALSVDAVARRARVNKTTIYRRWPTREALVRAALLQLAATPPPLPDGGSLRADLLQVARDTAESLCSPSGRSLTRLGFAGALEPKLMEMFRQLAAAQSATWGLVRERAVARGELPKNAEIMVLLEALGGALMHHIFLAQRPADERFLRALVDLLVDGISRPVLR
jgi:AcrR family transcriptional regulator